MKLSSSLALIGRTPLLALHRLSPPGSTIWAKAEFQNPGGSIKDRPARYILEHARASGSLSPRQPVVEMTSGNMGAGLAVVCATLGHPFIAVMSCGNSPERVRMLEALGAEVILVDQVDGRPGKVTGADIAAATLQAKRVAADRDGFYVDQFNNDGSTAAHELSTGPEIHADLGEELSAFVAIVGSAGTFVGVSRYLKRQRGGIVCAAVEPAGAEVLAGQPLHKPQHLIQGTGYGTRPPHWDPRLVDAYLAVTDEEVIDYKRRLAHQEGLHVGYSSAANVCACVKLIQRGGLGDAPQVATLLCDTGLKYA
ncbi:PLP-dependent cysteine synthase family protein [Halotalea alkalilenta]|uniref:PLP-dependent cysteine synthase family protein n=1 Tax=Halotalea alkalilenta TaxID=376489 RepID=UPI000489A675|nr:cysteine synthase family protein [Halotalea alkalilenta]